MKILCLNLERAVDRRKMIKKEWVDKLGFEIEFFKAFDRRELAKGYYPFAYDDKKTKERIGRSLSEGEIACATSHVLLLKYALEQGYEEVVVMEDDVRPTETASVQNLEASIASCKQSFPHVSVLIMHDDDGYTKVAESKNGINLLSFPPFGYRMVWLNRRAMELLINDLSTMNYQADCLWMKRFVPMKVLAMTVKPLGRGDAMDSYIGDEHRTGHKTFIP